MGAGVENACFTDWNRLFAQLDNTVRPDIVSEETQPIAVLAGPRRAADCQAFKEDAYSDMINGTPPTKQDSNGRGVAPLSAC
jgi:hypothetical protein